MVAYEEAYKLLGSAAAALDQRNPAVAHEYRKGCLTYLHLIRKWSTLFDATLSFAGSSERQGGEGLKRALDLHDHLAVLLGKAHPKDAPISQYIWLASYTNLAAKLGKAAGESRCSRLDLMLKSKLSVAKDVTNELASLLRKATHAYLALSQFFGTPLLTPS